MLTCFRIDIPVEALAELCRRYHVRELALFGSVLRDDFRDDSDIDVLVEYEPVVRVTLFDHSTCSVSSKLSWGVRSASS